MVRAVIFDFYGVWVPDVLGGYVESEQDPRLKQLLANEVAAYYQGRNDLEHIARSVAPRQRIEVLAPTCDKCGFRFKDRTRFSDPSRCPQCKNEHLSSQRLRIT